MAHFSTLLLLYGTMHSDLELSLAPQAKLLWEYSTLNRKLEKCLPSPTLVYLLQNDVLLQVRLLLSASYRFLNGALQREISRTCQTAHHGRRLPFKML